MMSGAAAIRVPWSCEALTSIIDLLVKIQVLDERQREAVQSRARSATGGHLVQQIADMGWATEGTVARAVSVELGLPRIDLAATPPEPAALALLDGKLCADRFLLPVALRENGELLWVAMADPTDEEAIGVVKRRSQKRVRPAVAGPTEILRAVRTLYPAAGTQPEPIQNEKLAAIEIESAEAESALEVLNVADDVRSSTPLSRIAEQLGVDVPPDMPSRGHMDARTQGPSIPPRTDPPPAPFTLEELFATGRQPGPIANDDLAEKELTTLEAVRSSLEKGALVLRALAELCVEKGMFTPEEFRKRKPPTGPVKPS
ncbi:MAG TPA: hypothetical protein VEP66_22800 [Myxococcales bacterium]|nr:hypothetical protein [Myxococcales bacterium]